MNTNRPLSDEMIAVSKLTIDQIAELYLEAHPRRTYGAGVITGRNRLSGSDLKGSARRWGGSYWVQRVEAQKFAVAHGAVITTGPRGLKTLEVPS